MIAAPYPADTLAKGWRFEIDLEKVERSDTWLRARNGALRGALLLLWSRAWLQTPCGTLPNDDELVALLIDMPTASFAKGRSVLMRGWVLADDGRLYHETITARVLAMLEKREADARRSADARARRSASKIDHGEVTGASRVTHEGHPGEFDTKHQAPSTKHQNQAPGKPKTRPPALTFDDLVADGLSPDSAQEWLTHRRAKKAALTPLAWAGFKAEVAKAPGWTLEAAVLKAIARNWTAFEAKWVADEGQGGRRAAPPPMDTATRNAEAKRLLGFADEPETLDATH